MVDPLHASLLRLAGWVRVSVDATRREGASIRAPVLDHLERIRKRLAVKARRAGMDDPMLVVVLDEEGVERDQELRKRERVPTVIDLDLDRRHRLESTEHCVGHLEPPSSLIACLERRIGPTVWICGDRPMSPAPRPHLRRGGEAGGSSGDTWGCEPIAAASQAGDSRGRRGGEDGALRDIHECSGGVERRAPADRVGRWEEAARLEAIAAAPRPGPPAQVIEGSNPAAAAPAPMVGGGRPVLDDESRAWL